MDTWFPTFRSVINLPTGSIAWPFHTSSARRLAVLRLIAVAIEEKLPLIPLLESWTADEYGRQQTRLRRLLGLLREGTPLADALEATPGVLRDEDVLAVRFDIQSGTRTAAIRQALEAAQKPLMIRLPGVGNAVFYFGLMLVACLAFLVFNQLNIAPVLARIMEEFSLQQPEVTRWNQDFAAALANSVWILGAISFLGLLVLVSRSGRVLRHGVTGWLSTPQRMWLAADVLQKLGIAANAGRPMAAALSTLARYHFDPAMRHKLLFVRNEVEQGVDAWQSMTSVGLLTVPEVHLLNTAQRVGNQAWVLRQLVEGKRRRTLRRSEQLSVFLLPVLVIALGGFVLLQGLALFQPLAEMLRSVGG